MTMIPLDRQTEVIVIEIVSPSAAIPDLSGVRACGVAITRTIGRLPAANRSRCPHLVAWMDDAAPTNLCRDCGAPMDRPPLVLAV